MTKFLYLASLKLAFYVCINNNKNKNKNNNTVRLCSHVQVINICYDVK